MRARHLIAIGVAFVLTLVCQSHATPQAAPSPVVISQSPTQFRMMGYRTRVGETFRVRVTGTTSAGGRSVWGTDVYTDDSDISAAVVHAGLLTPGQDGEVLVTILPGQNQYQGSTRNGVTTMAYGSWQSNSYRLARADASSASVPPLPPPTTPTPFFVSSVPNLANVAPISLTTSPFNVVPFPFMNSIDDQGVWQLLGGQPSGLRATLTPNLMGLRNRVGESFEYEVTGANLGMIWGDGIYTDDSDLGTAAVHAGLLRPGERGRVRITVQPGRQRYDGTSRNGITSQTYNSWEGSYRVESPAPTGPAARTVVPAASIKGRITDAKGQPLRGVTVAAASMAFRDGRLTPVQKHTALTSAEGEYLLPAVPPGSYLIVASPSSFGTTAYFPGVTTLDAAAQIPIRGSEQVVNIDFVASSPPLFKVTGKVLNPPAGGVPGLSVIQRDGFAAPLLANASANATGGEFELMLPAGAWDIFPVSPTTRQGARVPAPGVPAYVTGRASVDVLDRNVDGVTVRVGSADIAGRIVMPAGMPLPTMEIRLVPVLGTPAPLWHHAWTAQVRSEGRFTLPAVPPGNYRLEFFPAVPDAYVSDIRVGQASVFNDGILRVTAEPFDPVEVVFSSGGGTVQGDAQIAPAAARPVTSGKIVLVPMSTQRQNPLLYKQETYLAGRAFRFSNVPPGQYKVFAFENLPGGGAEMNAEFMSKYEPFGESIKVTGAGVVRVSVRMIEAEE